MTKPLSCWSVFARPADYPDGFIARRFECRADGSVEATTDTITGDTLEQVREPLVGRGLHRFPRSAADSPATVETWLQA